MEKRNIWFLFLLVLLSPPLVASVDLVDSLRTKARLAVAAIIGGCIAYEVYTQYTQPPLEPRENEESSPVKEEIEQNSMTLTDRAKYFGKGAGYGLLTVASILATYRSILLSLDRMHEDPIQERHDMFDRNQWPKSGADWEELLAQGYKERNSYWAASAIIGSLGLSVPYFAYYKYRFPHRAVENFRHAFQY